MPNAVDRARNKSRERGPVWGRWASALALFMLLGLSGGCAPDPLEQTYPNLYERTVQGNVFDTTPVRGDLRPLRHRHSVFEYKCSECHSAMAAPKRQNEQYPEHGDIVLNHGLNTNCLNCHHPLDRNAYVGYEGDVIPADQPARLCAKCHGPQFRDWERGVHGRQNGYWDKTRGERAKLFCIQCHDPHNPHFQLMTPSPPPVFNRFASTAEEAGHE